MTSRDQYMTVVRQLAEYMNVFKLAFKTYKVADLDEMIKNVAGDGARVSTASATRDFESLLQERGFLVYPSIADASDGYVRVIRANTIIANFLSAFRYPGANGDAELAGMLSSLRRRRTADDLGATSETDA